MSKKLGYGERIAEARKAAGYSQKRLLDALGWPSDSNSRLSGYENEEREPTLADFDLIARACHVDPAWLAFGQRRLDAELDQLIQGFLNATEEIQDVVRGACKVTVRRNRTRASE